jgi:hypothetical protein
MATYWLSVTGRCALAVLLAGGALMAKGKKHGHAAGFSCELPEGWRAENGPHAIALLPPGVKVDPGKEDNPEVYTIWASQGEGGQDLVSATRINLERGGVKAESKDEVFPVKDKPGTSHTFDFTHPERKVAYRIRIFSLRVGGWRLTLMANGLRERIAAREGPMKEIARSLNVP